jgi:hypothetical protein
MAQAQQIMQVGRQLNIGTPNSNARARLERAREPRFAVCHRPAATLLDGALGGIR